jgi:hypothetical protein
LRQQVDAAEAATQRRQAEQAGRAAQGRRAAAAAALRRAFSGRLELLHGHRPRCLPRCGSTQVRLVDGQVVLTGSAGSAAVVSGWLAVAVAGSPLQWSAPELRQVTGSARVAFSVHGQHPVAAR